MNKEFYKNGFIIIKNKTIRSYCKNAKKIFDNDFSKKFIDNPAVNRELIKRFADHVFISSIFSSKILINIIKKNIDFKIPVKCGPLVTHYTSHNKTGNSYGLPYHQDYPSMASSKVSIILWLNLVDSNENTHGLEILKGFHLSGLLKGKQKKNGYILDKSFNKLNSFIPSIKAGDLLIMSSFLPHKTHVNSDFDGWKLSMSQRYDDLSDINWKKNGYGNAYKTIVDRKLYLNSIT